MEMLPQRRQVLAFSATYPDDVRQALTAYMRSPEWVQVAGAASPLEGPALRGG